MIIQLLRNVEFRSFLAGNTISRLCASGLTVLLGLQVYELTRDPFYLGLLGLTAAVPGISLVLYGGDVADRHNRRALVLITLSLLAALAATLAVITLLEAAALLPVIYAVSFLTAAIRAFEDPASFGLEAQVLPRHMVLRGVPILASAGRVAEVTGPVAGGFAWAAFGPAATYGIIAALFAVSVLSIFAGVKSHPSPPRTSGVSAFRRIAEGVRYVFANQVLVGSMTLDLFAVFFAGANALLPAIATDILHVGPTGFGVLRSASAAGALVAALAATHFLPARHAGLLLHTIIALFGLSVIVFGLSHAFYLSLAALFIAGICDGVSMVIRHAILRLASPEAMRGRIAAVKSVFVGSSNELGAFQSGMVASVIGPSATLYLGGAVTLFVVGVVALRAPLLRKLNLEAAAKPVITEVA
ncbi:MFS transporter [Aquabacter sp. CN5-332]|uniref:MFS transporter n=1 Tax=Aquabacter sp. CN5-332 TaxID=3156608 RepID=UPI0032B4AF63